MTVRPPDRATVQTIYDRLQAASAHWEVTALDRYHNQPFQALITAMLSAQTREEFTIAASDALFALANTPVGIHALSDDEIRQAIRPVMYYESKLRYIRDICAKVLANGGEVPRTIDGLTGMKGVGWKVAVLTLAIGYGIHKDITVDVHVTRIGKRLGWVQPETDDPPAINEELKRILPRATWPHWNSLMVQFGRAVCKPIGPHCATCLIADLCPKVGVKPRQRGDRR
jgi:endonuclease III